MVVEVSTSEELAEVNEVNAVGPGVGTGGEGSMVLLGIAIDDWIEGACPGNVAD